MSRSQGPIARTFASLRVREFRVYFVGQWISQVGFCTQAVAQSLLVLELSESALLLGVVVALQFVPVFVLGLWAGLLADRIDKRTLMLATQSTMLGLTFVLGALVLLNLASIGVVVVLAALTGIAWALDQPTRRTIVADLVPVELLTNAVSLTTAAGNCARVVGPAVAGIVIATAGMAWCFLLNVLSYFAVLVALVRMGRPMSATPVARRPGQVREGLRYCWATPVIRVQLLSLTGLATLSLSYQVLIPLFATRVLGGGAALYSALMSVMSIGSVIGMLLVARREAFGLRLQAIAAGAYGVSLVLLAMAGSVGLGCAAAFAVGATSMLVTNAGIVTMQLVAEPAMRGRSMGVFSMLFVGGQGFGGLLAGWLASAFGTWAAIVVAGVSAAAIGGCTLAFSSRGAVRDQSGTVTRTIVSCVHAGEVPNAW